MKILFRGHKKIAEKIEKTLPKEVDFILTDYLKQLPPDYIVPIYCIDST